MTGFDPTAPERDTDRDDSESVPDNVPPPTEPGDTDDQPRTQQDGLTDQTS